MVQAIIRETQLQQQYLKEEITTIYFGGGTPSLLQVTEIQQLLEAIYSTFQVAPQVEITLEANPDDLSYQKLVQLQQAGINRLSIGVQSFYEPHLQFMNRAHNRTEALNCIKEAQQLGLENISLDLIYGIPLQEEAFEKRYSHEVWQQDLAQAIELQPKHISAYCLTIEPQTAFGKWSKQGKLPPIDEEFAAQQFELLIAQLENHQYEQYEISNFCLGGWRSKHNSNYWLSVPYLGLGPSAHSFNGDSRQFNIRNNTNYLKALAQHQLSFEKEILTHEDRINEYLMTSLRTNWGCSLPFLRENCQYDLWQAQRAELDFQQQQGTLYLQDDVIYLTKKGKLLADQLTARLFVSKKD